MKIMKTFLFIHVIKVYNHKSQSNILLYNCTSFYSFFSSVFNMFHYIFVYFKNSKGGGMVADFLVTSSNFVVRRPTSGSDRCMKSCFTFRSRSFRSYGGPLSQTTGKL